MKILEKKRHLLLPGMKLFDFYSRTTENLLQASHVPFQQQGLHAISAWHYFPKNAGLYNRQLCLSMGSYLRILESF
jgi:hypothetical protein